MLTQRAAKSYHYHQIRYASPLDLIVMLYDKTIAHLQAAISALEADRIDEKGTTLCRAAEIICELRAVLDHERGADIASHLDNLYGYMLEQLTIAHHDNDPDKIRLVIRLMEEVREGWRGIARPNPAPSAQP